MGEMSKKLVLETLSTSVEYSSKLKDLLKSIQEAEDQVVTSSIKTIADIDATFETLVRCISEALNTRRKVLKAEALKITEDGLLPLRACRDVINEKLKSTEDYISEGQEILRVGGATSHANANHFREQASLLGNLPAVPNLEEVPNLSFQSNADIFKFELEFNASNVGRVSRMGPVQISNVEMKPGALLVHWEEVDMERTVDINSYRLQLAYGDVRDHVDHIESNSHNVYVGPETHFLVRNLETGAPYTFRVCCRFEGDADWSAWSMPRVSSTEKLPFTWDKLNPNFMITNESKIATKVTCEMSTLFSSAAQFGAGHSIEFSVLECGGGCSDEGLGLVVERLDHDNLIQEGALFLSVTGSIYVDGSVKTTKLPPLIKGSKVTFTCDRISDVKIRVNIDSSNKSVTYDWHVDHFSCPQLYFALRLGEKSWKVIVE